MSTIPSQPIWCCSDCFQPRNGAVTVTLDEKTAPSCIDLLMASHCACPRSPHSANVSNETIDRKQPFQNEKAEDLISVRAGNTADSQCFGRCHQYLLLSPSYLFLHLSPHPSPPRCGSFLCSCSQKWNPAELWDLQPMSAPLPVLWGWVLLKEGWSEGGQRWFSPELLRVLHMWGDRRRFCLIPWIFIITWTDKMSPFRLCYLTWTFLDPVFLSWAAVYCNNLMTEFNWSSHQYIYLST